MGYDKNFVMQWMGVLGDMKRQGSHVISTCGKCRSWDVIDLDEMICLLGGTGASGTATPRARWAIAMGCGTSWPVLGRERRCVRC